MDGFFSSRHELKVPKNRWLLLDLSIGVPMSHKINHEGIFIEHLMFIAYKRRLFKGLYLSLGGIQMEYTPTNDTHSFRIDPLSLQYKQGFSVFNSLYLYTDINATFSLFQKTSSHYPFVRLVKPPLLACGSGSQIKARIGLSYKGIIGFEGAILIQGDPWHYVDGEACAGNSPLWQTRNQVRGRIYFNSGKNSSFHLGWVKGTDRLHVDTSDDHHLNADSHSGVPAHEHSNVGIYVIENTSINAGWTFRF